jgi:hypothetical protein
LIAKLESNACIALVFDQKIFLVKKEDSAKEFQLTNENIFVILKNNFQNNRHHFVW